MDVVVTTAPRSRHHHGHVHWKHLAVYAALVLLVTLLGGLAIWSYMERQSLVIVPEPLPRVMLLTADPNSPFTAAWVRLLHEAAVEATVVPSGQAGDGLVAHCGAGVAYLRAPVRGATGDAIELSTTPSPILARLKLGGELPARLAPVALLEETPAVRVDARWRTSARAAVMHADQAGKRVLWIGLDPDATPPAPALLLMLRTGFRWIAGQPISSSNAERFAYSVERLADRQSFAVRMINRGDRPIDHPTISIWMPPGVTRTGLGGDWIMRRGATIRRQDDGWVVSLPSLGRGEQRVLKLAVDR